jgi:hypothetical protein
MDNFLTRLLRHVLLAGCLGVAGAGHAENATGLLGIYSFADHSSMHFRTEPLMDFLQQRQVRLRLDVSNTYDELLLRAVRRDYLVLQAPMHFAVYLQRCCGYRIVAGWQAPISALLLKRTRPLRGTDSNHPQTVAVASLLSLVSLAMTGGCNPRAVIDSELHTLISKGTHERALQALLRGEVGGAIISSTALRALDRDLRTRLDVVKTIDGLPGDAILASTDVLPAPAWQVALEREFPDSVQAVEFQRRWHKAQGMVAAGELQLKPAENYAAQIDSCMQRMAPVAPTPAK